MRAWVDFIGHKNIAPSSARVISLWVLAKQRGFGF